MALALEEVEWFELTRCRGRGEGEGARLSSMADQRLLRGEEGALGLSDILSLTQAACSGRGGGMAADS